METNDLDRGPQERACPRSLVLHIVCLGKRNDRFFDTQNFGEDCQTMAGGFVLLHDQAGWQPDVLQIMGRATQINTRNSARIMRLSIPIARQGEEYPETLEVTSQLTDRR